MFMNFMYQSTLIKYFFIANINLSAYWSGGITVGSFPDLDFL